jgi:hypothetical protein
MQTYTALEHRPGDTPQLYDLGGGLVTQNIFGKVIRLDASQQVTALTPVPIEAEERYAFRAVFRRATNSPDPSDDAISCGIDWLAADKTALSTTTINTILNFSVVDGRREVRTSVVAEAEGPASVIAPIGARYGVPWVRTFGLGHATDVEVCSLERLPFVSVPVARTFYVTMDGKDLNEGNSLTSPLASITEGLARAAAVAQPCVVIVQPGEYIVPPDTVIPANCALYGYDLRVTKLSLPPGQEVNNMFQMSNGIKARGFTFANLRHEPYTLAGGPPQKGWSFVFKPGEVLTRSPYIADCSQLHSFTQDQMALPVDKAAGNPLMPRGGGNLLADGSVLAPSSPLRSVVVDSFTAINPNGVGYAVTRNAFVQLVSVFTNWARVGLWAHDGGQITVANSNNTFGDYALAATGFRNTVQIEGLAGTGVLATHTAAANTITTQTEAIITALMNTRYPTLTGFNGLSARDKAFTERDTRTLLRSLINDLRSGQDRGAQFFAKGLFDWNANYAFSVALVPLFLATWEQVRLELIARISTNAAQAMISALIGLISDVITRPQDYRVGFASVIEATGQQFSYAGSGVNYNALPFSQRGTGRAPDPASTLLKSGGGRIYATFSTEVGDTYLGEDLRVDFERNAIEGQAFSRGVQNIALPLIIGLGA